MALVSTPAMFAVPSSINKGFNPPFVLRVGVVSTVPTQIKATVAAYVLQKDQVAHPPLRAHVSPPLPHALSFLTS